MDSAWFRILVVTGCIACPLAMAGSSSATTTTGTPGPLPSCVAAEAGFNARQNAQVTAFADGGKLYTYEVGGQEIVLPEPPKGFEPLKASDSELERYEFPTRPSVLTEPEQLRLWDEMMISYKSTAPPVGCMGTPPPETGATDIVHHDIVKTNSIWSGFITSDPGNRNHWIAASGNWLQPSGNAHASCKSNAISSAWVGLGGWNYGGLIQAGTDAYTNGTYDAWYEWIAGSYDELAYFSEAVNPGDYMGVYVAYNVATETATYQMYDQNTKQYVAASMPGLPTSFYDGSSGDFIDERPSSGSGIYPLLNFGTNSWYTAQVVNANGTWVPLGEPNHWRIQMYTHANGTGNLLASPGYLTSSTSFQDNYYNCQ